MATNYTVYPNVVVTATTPVNVTATTAISAGAGLTINNAGQYVPAAVGQPVYAIAPPGGVVSGAGFTPIPFTGVVPISSTTITPGTVYYWNGSALTTTAAGNTLAGVGLVGNNIQAGTSGSDVGQAKNNDFTGANTFVTQPFADSSQLVATTAYVNQKNIITVTAATNVTILMQRVTQIHGGIVLVAITIQATAAFALNTAGNVLASGFPTDSIPGTNEFTLVGCGNGTNKTWVAQVDSGDLKCVHPIALNDVICFSGFYLNNLTDAV